jgi:hypothetical protein
MEQTQQQTINNVPSSWDPWQQEQSLVLVAVWPSSITQVVKTCARTRRKLMTTKSKCTAMSKSASRNLWPLMLFVGLQLVVILFLWLHTESTTAMGATGDTASMAGPLQLPMSTGKLDLIQKVTIKGYCWGLGKNNGGTLNDQSHMPNLPQSQTTDGILMSSKQILGSASVRNDAQSKTTLSQTGIDRIKKNRSHQEALLSHKACQNK